MSLFDQLDKYDIPTAPQLKCAVVIKKTRSGHDIMICTVEPAPQQIIDQAAAQHLPLFLPSEINNLAGANPEAVAAAINVKLTMPGSTIRHHQEDPAA